MAAVVGEHQKQVKTFLIVAVVLSLGVIYSVYAMQSMTDALNGKPHRTFVQFVRDAFRS